MRFPGLLAAVTLSLAAAPGAADAAKLEGRVSSGLERIGNVPVSLLVAGPGDRSPQRLARTRSARNGSFELTFSAAEAKQPPGSVFYVLAGKARLAAVLGAAPGSNAVLSERTTVAAGFGLAQFIHGSRLSGDAPGLANAASMAANLADAASGRLAKALRRPPNADQTSTLATFGTLANMVVPCARGNERCDRLFQLARLPGERRPRTVLEAIAEIARNPAHRAGALFRYASRLPRVYKPALKRSQKPGSWTLPLRFDGDGQSLDGPGNFAIDAGGSVWTLNNYEFDANPLNPTCGSGELMRFAPDGSYVPGSPYSGGGLSGAGYGISFDPTGNLWVGNYGFAGKGCDVKPPSNSVSEFTPDGVPVSPSADSTTTGGYIVGKISWPQGTDSDRAGSIWVANCGNDSVTKIPGGDPGAAFNIPDIGLEKPFDIAVNASGQAFVTAVGNDAVAMLEADGTPSAISPIRSGGLNRPMGIAIDSSGYMWVANSGLIDLPCPDAQPSLSTRGGSLTMIAPDGTTPSATAFEGGGLTIPWGITTDGDDNVWVANFGRQRVSEFCGTRPRTCPKGTETGEAISPGKGYGFDGLVRNTGLAVDPSGNVWVANNWLTKPVQTNPGGHQVVVYVGVAAPIETPIIGPPVR